MRSFNIIIRYNPKPVRPSAAWFVIGGGAAEWLEEICQWGVPLGQLTLYLVPASLTDRKPAGALVTVRGTEAPSVSPRAIPYGCIAQQFYLPVEAQLSPPVEDAELAALIGTGLAASVWHPVCGLVGFEPEDALSVSALLAWPPSREADWGRARPGIAVNGRLRSVEPDAPLTIETIMEEGRDDIGSQSQDLPQQPGAPGESALSTLKGMGAQALSAAARAGKWLVNQLPQTASSETWADHLGSWLNKVAQSASQRANYESERARELRRLLHMLANDPDQGLKYALKFGGEGHRGQAPASGRLASNDVNFDLSRMGGGGPADFWYVPAQVQQDLIREYRRLAERELHLGRHRRAAYIFAELLNDLSAAAAALAAGRHFREAAVLYRERLKQPHEAAKCLEQGGLWSEALNLYEELQEFEKAGDLAGQLEQPADAEQYYRLALERIRHRGDYLAGAKLLERKLHVPDEALELLLRGWSSLHQHRQCVGETFRLLGQLGRHDAACQRLARCTTDTVSTFLHADSIGELAQVARTYPDETARLTAADTVRVLAASRVHKALGDERRLLLDAVAGLAPEDRLLSRDCRRFLEQTLEPVGRPPPIERKSVRKAELVREMVLPANTPWSVVRSTDTGYYAAAMNHRTLVVLQGGWIEHSQTFRTFWTLDQFRVNPAIVLEPDPQETHPLHVHLPDGPVLPPQILRLSGDQQRETTAGSPPWATHETLALARAPFGVTWAVNRSAGGLSLAAYNSRNRPVASRLIEVPEELGQVADDFRVFMQVRELRVYVGLWDRLVIAREQGDNEIVELPGMIRGLACSVSHSRRRLAVTYEMGGQIAWDDEFGERQQWFGQELAAPLVEFTTTGMLVAASSQECQIYSTSDCRVRLAAECHWKEGTPIGVLRTGVGNEFAVAFADGRLLVYRVKV